MNIWNNVWPYLVAVGVFLLIIIIHEFGHFLFAKLFGVRVNEFAVGFGPKLFSKKMGETNYAFNLVPLGGYCAMEGEDEGSSDPRAFCNKKPIKRLVIVAAGAIFNLILGLIIIAIILAPSERFTTTTVAEFHENSISAQSGLMVGDTIKNVDGRKIFTTYDLSYAFTNVDDGVVDMTVERGGKTVEIPDVKFKTQEENGISYLTVDFYVEGKDKTFGSYITHTVDTAISYCAVIWRSLFDLITGKYGISAMSGPVGVTAVIGNAAKQSLESLLPIMALITINLGIFNLLPVPALDGGRIMFILYEIIFKKPVPQRYEAIVHGVGFAILFGFMLLITAKDIWMLITG